MDLELEAAEIAQKKLDGNPRMMLLALSSAMVKASESAKVTARMMEAACNQVVADEGRLRSMLPKPPKSRRERKPSD